MSLKAGELRHRVTFQRKVATGQDANSGEVLYTWQDVSGLVSVPAKIEPLSVRELLAAQQVQSKMTARVVIRWTTGIDPAMRISHPADGLFYNIEGLLPDNKSMREWLTLPVYQGVNQG